MNRFLAALAATLALTAGTAQAAPLATPASKNMVVSTTVIPACTFALTDFAVGTYDANATLTNTHPINFTCTTGTTFNLVLTAFTGKLTSAASDTLNYTLANKNGSWAKDGALSVTGTGAAQSETLTATIAAGQYVPAIAGGTSYSETITFALEL